MGIPPEPSTPVSLARPVSRRLRLPFWRRLHHLHRPDCAGAHVHGSAVISGDDPRLGRAEPIALGIVRHMIDSPGGAKGFFFHSLGEKQGRKAETRSRPYLSNLLVGV